MSWALYATTEPDPELWDLAYTWDTVGSLAMAFSGRAGGYQLEPPLQPRTEAALGGTWQPMFDRDFYNRLHLSITVMALGNVVGEQQRVVSVWNAFDFGVTLTSLATLNGEGIEVAGQPAPPLDFAPLQEREWTVTVAGEGPPTIDATVVWTFAGGTQLRLEITGNRVTPWNWRPDWSKGIGEVLEWRTDVIEAEYGDEQRIAMRMTPRQTWEFTASASGTERQAMEATIVGWGSRVWALPQWPHGADLVTDATAGALELVIPTFGRGFVPGGLAMLLAGVATGSEVTEILDVEADRLVLKRPLARTWRAGQTVVYPAKPSVIEDAAQLSRFTGKTSDVRLRFMTDQANPYPALEGLPQYRGYGVLEDIPDWSAEPTLGSDRKLGVLDNGTALPARVDRAGVPILRQAHRWGPIGRAQLDRFRRLQYLLKGMRGALWIPSWADDLTVEVLAGEGATSLDVAWCGYTAYLEGNIHRQDVRIENDAGVQYRRITGATDLGNGLERLALDAALTIEVDPDDPGGTRISFLTLWRQDSDRQEWAWWCGDLGGDQAHADTPMPVRTFRHDV